MIDFPLLKVKKYPEQFSAANKNFLFQ